MEDKFVNIKIREEYRDMLKDYSKHHGYKMYALLEELIKQKCTKRILYSNQKIILLCELVFFTSNKVSTASLIESICDTIMVN